MKSNDRADVYIELGRQSFMAGQLRIALCEFNMSLCQALPGSEQMAYGYANRAQIYLEMKQFKMCLENIKMARKNTYPKEAELNILEKMCFINEAQHQPDPEDDLKSFIKLSYPANKTIPFIANCLELREDRAFGRHIIANHDLNPGDIIAIEEPIFGTVNVSSQYKRCSYCLKSNLLNLIPCDGHCTRAMFCNQKCLTEAKNSFHNIDCSVLDELKSSPCHAEMLRTLAESLTIQSSVDKLTFLTKCKPTTVFDVDFVEIDPEKKRRKMLACVNSLKPSVDVMEHLIFEEKSRLLVQCSDLFGTSEFFKSADECERAVNYLRRLMQIKTLNNCIMHNNEGSGVLLFGSLLNHSCVPNVSVIYNDNKVALVVIKPIRKDDQLFLSYILSHIYNTKRELRQEKLCEAFSFECSCPACSEPQSSKGPNKPKELKLVSVKTVKDAKEMFRRSCDFIQKNYKAYSSPTPSLIEAEHDLYNALFALSSFTIWPVRFGTLELNHNVL